MRIAQVCPNYYPYIGGVETLVKEINERLTKKGFDVEVLTTDFTGKLSQEEYINGVYVKRFKSWAPGEAYYFSRELERYLKNNSDQYDIIHTHSYASFPSLYAAQSKKKNKLIYNPHYHGSGHTLFRSLLHIPYKYIGRKSFDKSDKIVCVSRYEKNLILRNFKVDEKKTVIIPNGVNLEEFKSLKKKENKYRNILYVGRLEKYKGIHHLLNLLPRMNDNIILNIVGKGPYRKSLDELIERLILEDRVVFYQDLSRHELLQKYVDADVFVLLSKKEAYGISVSEALASGIPCIVADSSALSEWIDNKNCFGVKYPINLEELEHLIYKVMGLKIEDLKLPDWNEVTDQIINLYNSV